MFEKYPSKQNLDVAYQGDFEDTAWTKFSDAQLPPPRLTLEDFAKHPFVAYEITSKSDYVRHVITRFSKALKDAGYKEGEVDGLISKSLDKIDFNQSADVFVADINRIIQNFYKAAPVKSESVADQKSSETIAAPQVGTVASAASVIKANPTPVAVEQNGNLTSVPQLEDTSEVDNLRLTTEFDEREAEHAEYSGRKIEPVRLVPQFKPDNTELANEAINTEQNFQSQEKLVLTNKLQDSPVIEMEQTFPDILKLTPEMRVTEANEPIILQTIESVNEPTFEKIDTAQEYQNKLDALNSQPFNHDAYFEFVFDLHTGLRHEYDEVVNTARKNLKRFDGIYAPSTVEKQALQLLSSLQGQYAKMQNPESDYGLSRGAISEKLSVTPTEAIVADIKVLTQNYLDASRKLFANINKLQSLVELAKTEEKSSISEVYQAHFEKIQTEGNQVLQALPDSHPLYKKLKFAIDEDLKNILDAINKDGDAVLRDSLPNLTARRNQIKELIAFVKKEQEYQDFFERARVRVQKLESQFESMPQTDAAASVKQLVAENLVKIKQSLAETAPQIGTDGVLDTLRAQKDTVQNLLLESGELLTSLPVSETVLKEPKGVHILTDEEMNIHLEDNPLVLQIAQNIKRNNELKFLSASAISTNSALERRRQLEVGGLSEKVRRLALKISPLKIGKAAVLALAFYAGSAEKVSEASKIEVRSGSMISGLNLSSPAIDQNSINEYLRMFEAKPPLDDVVSTQTIENPLSSIPPTVNELIPDIKTPKVTIETVPDVILPDMVTDSYAENYNSPLKIFSEKADSTRGDPGVAFESPKLSDGFENLREPYKINFGDKFWDINEGQTLAGNLPVMSQINPFFKQALIARMRDKINNDVELRNTIGGFGKTADQLKTGELMNLNELHKLGIELAVGYGYLKIN